MDVGVDLVDRGLDLVVDIHPVITLTYGGLDSIWSPGLYFTKIFQNFFNFFKLVIT
jgi:hypothetical protein